MIAAFLPISWQALVPGLCSSTSQGGLALSAHLSVDSTSLSPRLVPAMLSRALVRRSAAGFSRAGPAAGASASFSSSSAARLSFDYGSGYNSTIPNIQINAKTRVIAQVRFHLTH